MKATGIVRKVDELGRLVLPKELRRTLHIDIGDPMEIFTEDDTIVLRKYAPDHTDIEDRLEKIIGDLSSEDRPRADLIEKLVQVREALIQGNAPL